MKKLLLVAGGGDCPKLNAVIRAVVKAADKSNGKHLVEWKLLIQR
jgi:6-phosphofructokinase